MFKSLWNLPGPKRARLITDVKGSFVWFYANTLGWVRVEDGVFWFSDKRDFNKEIMVNGNEFRFVNE